MNLYPIVKNILFNIDPEKAHYLVLKTLKKLDRLGLLKKQIIDTQPRTLMGLCFPNPVGLAAGFDRSADYIDALATLGFGFLEIGTVTLNPQVGNPKPRIFRLKQEDALINRMGFYNKGVEHVIKQLEKTRYQGILGISIVKNRDTPLDYATDDYIQLFRLLWKYASYFAINVSSPNTPGTRDLQQIHRLKALIVALKTEQLNVVTNHKKYVPIVIKLSPDLTFEDYEELGHLFLQHHVDGVIATNTSTQRSGVEHAAYAKEVGGLSGEPLHVRNVQIVERLHRILGDAIPIIASGGIMSVKNAEEEIAAGAKLVQVYTGLIYKGPRLISELASAF